MGTIARFFHFVAEEKKKDKKTKAFYDWATIGIPVIMAAISDFIGKGRLGRERNLYQEGGRR